MKKLFVAILALGALASCQKENLPTENAQSKTIEISIVNETSTRAQGGDTEKGAPNACAQNSELTVLFAKADGTILHYDSLTSEGTTNDLHTGTGTSYVKDNTTGKYIWHMVDKDVKQIAVVRFKKGDAEGNEGDITITKGTTNISEILALAENEALNLNRPINEIVLYGVGTLTDTNKTHRVGTVLYHVWSTTVEVAPKLARFEIHSIKCTDLGDKNRDTDLASYGLDELLINSLTWTGATEAHTAVGFPHTIYGSYNNPSAANNTQTDADQRSKEYKPKKGAWSWNVLPCTFTGLTLDMTAATYDYVINDGNYEFPLTVTGLNKVDAEGNTVIDNEFDAGKIYVIDLIFEESNISAQDAICVDVTVEVVDWVIENRTPIYSK